MAAGYASGSSTRNGEYESAGAATAPTAAKMRVRPRDDQAGEEVRGKDRRGHQRDAQELDHGVGRVHVVQPPGRRGQVGEQRDVRRRMADAGAEGGVAGVGDRA